MLLPMLREDLFDQLDEYGVDVGIGKPIIPSILFNGILDIFQLKPASVVKPSEMSKNTCSPLAKSRYVLVAEDNKTNQLIAQSLLEQLGIVSILAADGKAAIALFEQYKEKIDFILMDLHMPIMNGYEAAKQIRSMSEAVPIVAMTADVILGVKEQCEQCGMSHYISKPFNPDRFIQIVKEIIFEQKGNRAQDLNVLDSFGGLKNVGGDQELYRQVLKEYFLENHDLLDKLFQAAEEKRYSDAALIVHKVKSSSGSIGAKALYDVAVKLQKAFENQNEQERSIFQNEFSILFRKLLEEIKEVLNQA
jgi:CheY-like chemotaxis protein